MSLEPDNARRKISELLKSADRAIKDGNLDGSMGFIERVFEIDSRNVYARAYKERILALKGAEAREKAGEKKKASEIAAQPLPPPDKKEPEEKVSHLEKTAAAIPSKGPPPRPAKLPIAHSPAALEAYRTLLVEMWQDGVVSSEEQSQIDSMKETFDITEKEHGDIERKVRIDAYLDAIREAWKKGITSFVDIRQRFRITDQEHLSVEQKINEFLQSLKSRGTVLLLDDDQSFLNIIQNVLTEAGFNCVTASSGEEGLTMLQNVSPDIVICDIDFVKPRMNGFTFYEKFRTIDRFVSVPFVFLSGLDQDLVVRAGKQLGADDYLTKPLDAEMLIATIEGKLKRSREIRRVTSTPRN